jgi:hypothetical protein
MAEDGEMWSTKEKSGEELNGVRVRAGCVSCVAVCKQEHKDTRKKEPSAYNSVQHNTCVQRAHMAHGGNGNEIHSTICHTYRTPTPTTYFPPTSTAHAHTALFFFFNI